MANFRGWKLGVGLAIGACLIAGLTWTSLRTGRGGKPEVPGGAESSVASMPLTPDSTLAELAAGLREGDGLALAILVRRLTPEAPEPLSADLIENGLSLEQAAARLPNWEAQTEAIPSEEADVWVAILDGLGRGYGRFSPYGRASATVATAAILDRYAIRPAPGNWEEALVPAQSVTTAGLGDPDASVRFASLRELARFWTWSPGRDLDEQSVELIASVKSHLYDLAVVALEAPEGPVRGAAVACLAALPLDPKAAPAVKLLDDPDVKVRLGVLQGFADRRELLEEESLLPLLYDPTPGMAATAEAILIRRGMSPSMIGLGKLAVNPRAEVRASAVSMILVREDVDPVVWLVFLSRDPEASVRLKAAEALADRDSHQARDRLAEMAESDESPAVRQVAAAAVPDRPNDATASLPPLPGSPRLNPTAN